MAERWSTETEEIVVRALRGPDDDLSDLIAVPQDYETARDVLAALADAGLLIPPAEPVWALLDSLIDAWRERGRRRDDPPTKKESTDG